MQRYDWPIFKVVRWIAVGNHVDPDLKAPLQWTRSPLWLVVRCSGANYKKRRKKEKKKEKKKKENERKTKERKDERMNST